MVAVDATLKLRHPDTSLVDLEYVDDAAAQNLVAMPTLDAGALAELQAIVASLGAGVALDAATLAALESITATIANLPDVYPLAPAQAPTKDVFGNLVTGQRDNQIEVHFDDTGWASYGTTTQTGGGGATQHEGHVHFTSSTGANGRSKFVTTDVIKYRPMHEVYAGWTAAFPTAGVANSFMRIGLGDDTNGAFVGYEGTSFGLTWRQNGTDTFVAQAAWDDPCDGSPGSLFTRAGTPEALNPAFTNIYRVRVGLLGSAPLIFEALAPDGEWITFHTLLRPNLSSEPTFTNFDLGQFVEVRKTGADATALEIRTACWAGGTTSDKARLSDAITDRSLATTVRAVIEGQTPSGTYEKLSVNSQGRLQVTNDSVSATGAATPTNATLVAGSDGTTLRALKTDADGNVQVEGTVAVSNLPADPALNATLISLLTELGAKLEPGGEVELGAATLIQLETVSVANADFPLPAAQVSTLTPQTDALTDAQLRAATVDAANPAEVGTWGYVAGTSGTENVVGRVLGITATGGTGAATLTINGGDTITIPANMTIEFTPKGNLVNPTIVFTSTVSYVVETVT